MAICSYCGFKDRANPECSFCGQNADNVEMVLPPPPPPPTEVHSAGSSSGSPVVVMVVILSVLGVLIGLKVFEYVMVELFRAFTCASC